MTFGVMTRLARELAWPVVGGGGGGGGVSPIFSLPTFFALAKETLTRRPGQGNPAPTVNLATTLQMLSHVLCGIDGGVATAARAARLQARTARAHAKGGAGARRARGGAKKGTSDSRRTPKTAACDIRFPAFFACMADQDHPLSP